METDPPGGPVANLVRLLNVEELDADLYRGAVTTEPWKRTFGGQVAAQALAAAARTVPAERVPHSLHAYFMRGGDARLPIIYQVFRDRDGGSFSARRVVALQGGKPILNFAASFHIREDGYAHQLPMPDVPPPEVLPDEAELVLNSETTPPAAPPPPPGLRGALEFRPVEPGLRQASQARPPCQHYWFRVKGRLPDDALLHRLIITYASDAILLSTAVLAHPVAWTADPRHVASLDHSVWLHEDARVDEWLLYSMDSPWSGHARGMNRGLIYTRAGVLVASTAQEGLLRQV
ncbi:MAG: acyl-CoA thioesterase II [Rhodospirillales bacterium]|nr:acyl-CoA thioesterase II [Rhodospirillales bacterium]MDE2390302.1 acyl-CoA thioesterase II [Rhodospirillales bacterium]MDE2458542.1 acyl-CoA thioesterase II [Rhodospirillales bacterium]